MHKVLTVIRREYLERVRKKSWWIGTFVIPLLILGLMFGMVSLFMMRTEQQRRIGLADGSGALFEPLQEAVAEKKLKDGRPQILLERLPLLGSVEATRKAAEPRIGKKDLYAIVTAEKDLYAENAFRFYGQNVGNIQIIAAVERALAEVVVRVRFERSGLAADRAEIERLMAPVDLETFQISETGEARKRGFNQAIYGTFIFIVILYMALLLYGIAVMRGVLEEKSNRVMEVLLGSMSPRQLMVGKILGIGLVGLTQMAVYAATAGALRMWVGAQNIQGDLAGMLDSVSPLKMAYFVVFFVLGYFLYVGIFAAIGAVCNSEQEAQNLQTPVTMILVVPYAASFFVIANPDSMLATVGSLIPFFTPILMYARISTISPPVWEIALSIALLLLSIWLVFRGVAKIFRVGVLMYGKRPTIPEILRWARD